MSGATEILTLEGLIVSEHKRNLVTIVNTGEVTQIANAAYGDQVTEPGALLKTIACS